MVYWFQQIVVVVVVLVMVVAGAGAGAGADVAVVVAEFEFARSSDGSRSSGMEFVPCCALVLVRSDVLSLS